MSQPATLYRLQTLDSEADAKQHRLSEIEALLGQNTEIGRAREVLECAGASLRSLKAKTQDLELEIASISDKATLIEKQLYSRSDANPKELQDMQSQEAALRRRGKALEEELLEAMIAVEEGQERMTEARAVLEDAQTRHTALQSHLAEELAVLQTRLEELEAEHEAERAKIKPENLQLYARLRQSRGGVAVACVEDGSCMACGIQPSSSTVQRARHGEIVQCPNCNRILYAP